MKKLITVLLIISMLLLTTSCDLLEAIQQLPSGDNGPTINPDGTINYVDMTAADYDELNKLVAKVGESFTVKVNGNYNGAILNAEYAVNADTVRYTVEQLNKLPEDAAIDKLPETMASSYSGEAKLNENGELVTEDGALITLPEGETVKGKFNFSEDNFRNAKRSPYGFEGEATSVSSLFGVKLSVDSMTVKVDYTETEIVKIVITYAKDSSTVTVTYEFN